MQALLPLWELRVSLPTLGSARKASGEEEKAASSKYHHTSPKGTTCSETLQYRKYPSRDLLLSDAIAHTMRLTPLFSTALPLTR